VSESVVVVSADAPAYAMPAAAWAAKSGDSVLFTHRDTLPPDTLAAIRAHRRPRVYVLGPSRVISERVLALLRRHGTVTRIQGADPASNSVAFARFVDGSFGWGIVDPGHGFVFANSAQPADAGAAAPLSASGTYGALLVTANPRFLPGPLTRFLLDLQPGYTQDPVRGVYNHGWIIGGEQALSVPVQARIDSLLEIVPVSVPTSQPTTP
jgi:hypothetical protein